MNPAVQFGQAAVARTIRELKKPIGTAISGPRKPAIPTYLKHRTAVRAEGQHGRPDLRFRHVRGSGALANPGIKATIFSAAIPYRA